MSKEELFARMAQSVIDGEVAVGIELANQSLAGGIDPIESTNLGFRAGLDDIGRGFETGDYFLPDLVLAGKVMQAAVDVLEGAMKDGAADQARLGKVLIATVEGDIHTIGKDLVALMLSLNGFEVINLGHNVPTQSVIEQTTRESPDIVALSSLLSTTTQAQSDVVTGLQEVGLRDAVSVLVGAAACSVEWAQRIGADGYAEDAAAAVIMAKEMINTG